jgi:hypothetical protein
VAATVDHPGALMERPSASETHARTLTPTDPLVAGIERGPWLG